ncbi:hypothetical protein E2C01_065897 [Portunus trituberculatus]|uniref:Uncharacterized protein n=1 Tax=Portunus trituberculatus TaxID=210409 RepID=A0A5B7HND4_PORTR|nr:hypothetical protein [Portunus trituberculatus]
MLSERHFNKRREARHLPGGWLQNARVTISSTSLQRGADVNMVTVSASGVNKAKPDPGRPVRSPCSVWPFS